MAKNKAELGSKENPIKLTRTGLINLLNSESQRIVGIDFFAEADGETVLKTGAYRRGVQSHLHGGHQCGSPEFKASEHGLITVYKMTTRKRAIAAYQKKAQADLDQAQSERPAAVQRYSDAVDVIDSADKVLKKHVNERDAARKALDKIDQKIRLANLKLSDPKAAALEELQAKIERTKAKIAKADGVLDDPGSHKVQNEQTDELQRLRASLERDESMLGDPVKSLMATYRSLSVTSIRSARSRGKHYVVTTGCRVPLQQD